MIGYIIVHIIMLGGVFGGITLLALSKETEEQKNKRDYIIGGSILLVIGGILLTIKILGAIPTGLLPYIPRNLIIFGVGYGGITSGIILLSVQQKTEEEKKKKRQKISGGVLLGVGGIVGILFTIYLYAERQYAESVRINRGYIK